MPLLFLSSLFRRVSLAADPRRPLVLACCLCTLVREASDDIVQRLRSNPWPCRPMRAVTWRQTNVAHRRLVSESESSPSSAPSSLAVVVCGGLVVGGYLRAPRSTNLQCDTDMPPAPLSTDPQVYSGAIWWLFEGYLANCPGRATILVPDLPRETLSRNFLEVDNDLLFSCLGDRRYVPVSP